MSIKFENSAQTTDVFGELRDNIIGSNQILDGPFGPRQLLYADYVASGRSYGPIEDSIRNHVLPFYANTHSEASATGRQTSAFREQARNRIAQSIGANEQDAIIFCGNGCTGAINKLIHILSLKLPDGLDKFGVKTELAPENRPVVLIGPYEHHSNDVQWRETIAEVITIEETADGLLDLADLELQLTNTENRPLVIGSFSVASNVTGIRTDPVPVAKLLHKYGAIAAFDFAAAAPYTDIQMNGPDQGHFDAIYLSPHKFVGGPGTPGLLILKKHLAQNKTPVVPGGGTVSYVSPCQHAYLTDISHREEGGTPDIVGSIRAGLVFDLKEKTGLAAISKAEHKFAQLALKRWGDHSNINILGSNSAPRLPIFSFQVQCGAQYLHYNFVVTLLDDLFGIQARGGCSCAGPYGHRLLGIDLETSQQYEEIIRTGLEILKPGWVRIGFSYFFSNEQAELVLRAVEWIAERGHLLLPAYQYNSTTGEWAHRDSGNRPLLDLLNIQTQTPSRPAPESVDELIKQAEQQVEKTATLTAITPCPKLQFVPEPLKWFAQAK